MDHSILGKVSDKTEQWLGEMKDVAIKTNKKWAKKLGINQAAKTLHVLNQVVRLVKLVQ